MKKFIGIDLHSNNSVVVITDEEDRIIFQKRMANDLKAIEMVLAPHREEVVGVVIESTYNWYFLVDGLMDAGYRVHLANTSAIKKYEGLKYSGDFADAAYLAHLLRLGLLPEGEKLARYVRCGGGWKRDYGSRIEGHCESRGIPTGAYCRRASPRPYRLTNARISV